MSSAPTAFGTALNEPAAVSICAPAGGLTIRSPSVMPMARPAPSASATAATFFISSSLPTLLTILLVMRGLDPRIHSFQEDDGLPGRARSSPAMTIGFKRTVSEPARAEHLDPEF